MRALLSTHYGESKTHKYGYTFRKKNGWGVTPADAFPAPTHCHECGNAGTEYGYSAGVHVGDTRDGERIEQSPAVCYVCCHAHDVAQLQDRTKPFVAYVSCDGKSISNWPGANLGAVTAEWRTRSGFADVTCYQVRDVHGGRWYGKGSGRGMCITLRPCK